MASPNIQSAIPKRRYQFGEFVVTLLSDIDSPDTNKYLYIAAVMREGSTQPEVYITCEAISVDNKDNYRIRVLSNDAEHIIGEDQQWKHEQKFCDYALDGIKQMFQLTDEIPVLLS